MPRLGKVALGQRIVKPALADMDSFEDRLRAWEEDVERLNRINEGKNDVDDALKAVYLEDLMPTVLRERYNMEKHLLRDYDKLKQRFDRMILEDKNSKALQRPRGLHDWEKTFSRRCIWSRCRT